MTEVTVETQKEALKNSKETLMRLKLNERTNDYVSSSNESETEVVAERISDIVEVEEKFSFDDCYDHLISASNDSTAVQRSNSSSTPKSEKNTTSINNAIDIEVEKYISLEMLEKNGDPLEWWESQVSKFSKLSNLALKYLSCSPSSVESERLFSIGGNVYTYTT